MLPQQPLPSCSKGSRGLSVLLRVTGIFTGTTVSLSLWLRQWGNRYAIRAGRNFMVLPCSQGHRLCLHLDSAVMISAGWNLRLPLGFMPAAISTISINPSLVRCSLRSIRSHIDANDSKSACLADNTGHALKCGITRLRIRPRLRTSHVTVLSPGSGRMGPHPK